MTSIWAILENSEHHLRKNYIFVTFPYLTEVIGMVDTPMDNTKKFFDTLNQWGNANPVDDGCIVKVWPAIDQ